MTFVERVELRTVSWKWVGIVRTRFSATESIMTGVDWNREIVDELGAWRRGSSVFMKVD